jgi:hypothetical protein
MVTSWRRSGKLTAAHARTQFVIEPATAVFASFYYIRHNDTAGIFGRGGLWRERQGAAEENYEGDRKYVCHGKSPNVE